MLEFGDFSRRPTCRTPAGARGVPRGNHVGRAGRRPARLGAVPLAREGGRGARDPGLGLLLEGAQAPRRELRARRDDEDWTIWNLSRPLESGLRCVWSG